MESILRTTPSYEQLIEELDSLKKKVLNLEKDNNEISFDNHVLINDYPTLQELAKGTAFPNYNEIKGDISLSVKENRTLTLKLLKETKEKELLKAKLLKASKAINDLKEKNNKSKKRIERLFGITRQLKIANADLENFIYSASHDLRSPISNLEGLIQILKNELENKIGTSELTLIRMITTSIVRFKQTIFDLTELSTFQKQVEEAQEPIMLEEVLEDVKTNIHNQIEESGATIETDFSISEVKFARKNLRSIIFNLLINAVKYRSLNRPLLIKLSSRKRGNWVLFTIEDNGLGFLPEQKEKLFQIFKRIHTHVDGTGVGLYIVKKIIENNGGRIEVESDLDKGSKFKIFFKV
ncbi:MAG: ATP-binding protein [Bacteroidota bacterium]|nr:ATP-binding protein [Bacteroidota bacterium]